MPEWSGTLVEIRLGSFTLGATRVPKTKPHILMREKPTYGSTALPLLLERESMTAKQGYVHHCV